MEHGRPAAGFHTLFLPLFAAESGTIPRLGWEGRRADEMPAKKKKEKKKQSTMSRGNLTAYA